MSGRKLHIPAFRDESLHMDGTALPGCGTGEAFNSVVVVRWGRVRGFTFRAGDRLLLEDCQDGRGLLLLRPKGYGWPMLGRKKGTTLMAEPGGVRAAPQRWRAAARVVGVERSLGRSVTDRGSWHVKVLPRAGTAATDLEAAGLVGGLLSNEGVDAICHRAARWMEGGNGAVAIGVAPTAAQAAALAAECPAGRLRTAAEAPVAPVLQGQDAGDVVVGPWLPRTPASEGPTPIVDARGVRYDSPRRVSVDEEPAAQVPLFRRVRNHRAS